MKSLARFVAVFAAAVLLSVPAFAQNTSDNATKIKELEQKLAALTAAQATPATVPAETPADKAVPAPAGQAGQTPTDVEKRIKELEARIAELEKQQAAQPALTLMNNQEIERITPPVDLNSFFDNGYLVFTSKNGDFKYWLDGRVMLDAASYQGAENRLPSGVEVRRARIGLKTTLYQNWLAEVDFDFADAKVSIKDLWMGYTGFGKSLIRAGNFKSPFGLDNLISSKHIMFIERSYIDALVPDRRMGVGYSQWGNNWQVSGGVFTQEAGLFNDKDTLTGGGAGTDLPLNYVGRFTIAPLNKPRRVVHLGIAGAYRQPDVAKFATSGADLPDRENAARIVKLDARAETHVSRAKFLSTGDMKYVDHFTQYDVEFLAIVGPLTVQSEYMSTSVTRKPTTVAKYSDHSFSGYYVQAGYFLTGDSRSYWASEGEYGRVLPRRKMGAIEATFRYNTMDLDDATTVDPILGGGAKNTTFGLNWYFNANNRLMFNVVNVNNNANARPGKDWAPIPPGTGTTLTPIYGDDFTTIAVRFQIAF